MPYMQVSLSELDSMIATVDRNKDGKISYSEFRSDMIKLGLVLGDSHAVLGGQEQPTLKAPPL